MLQFASLLYDQRIPHLVEYFKWFTIAVMKEVVQAGTKLQQCLQKCPLLEVLVKRHR